MSALLPSALVELNARCHLTWKRYLERAYLPFKINLKQYYILKLATDQDVSPADICQHLFCDKPTASIIIKNLLRHDWMEKINYPTDKRRYLLRLTPKGQTKLKELRDNLNVTQQFNSGLTEDEQQQLRNLLQKQLAYLEDNCL